MNLCGAGDDMDSILEIRRKAQEAQGQVEPQTDTQAADSSRDYSAIFRAAFNFLQRHSPVNQGADYWAEALKDLNGIMIDFNQDSLLMGLLQAIYADLEREYKHMLEAQESA